MAESGERGVACCSKRREGENGNHSYGLGMHGLLFIGFPHYI